MGRKAPQQLKPGRALQAPRTGNPEADRALVAVAAAVNRSEREHVGAGDSAHAVASPGAAGFLPALEGAEGDVLTLERGDDGVLRAVWRAP